MSHGRRRKGKNGKNMEGMLNNDLVECRLVMLTMIKYVHSLTENPLSDQEKVMLISSDWLISINNGILRN